MVILILMLATGAMAAMAAWLALQWLQKEYTKYRVAFQHDTAHGLEDFFLFLDPGQLWGVTVILAITGAMLFFVITGQVLVAGLAAAVALALPRWALRWARQRRKRLIDEQLPDFLLALAGALQAGSGLQAGLRQVAQHAGNPLRQELSLILQLQRVGVAFNDALDALQVRVATESIGLVVAAIKVAGQTGGGLAETLERISQTLRTRQQLLGKIRALTSQGRMQAWVMAGLPLVLVVALYALDPGAMALLWQSVAGWAVVAVVVGLETVGIYLVRRIVGIEV